MTMVIPIFPALDMPPVATGLLFSAKAIVQVGGSRPNLRALHFA
jgi:hypothetical protein